MSLISYINAIAYLIFSIIILWNVSLEMIYRKRILLFLPFVLIGITACFYASFIINNIFISNTKNLLEYVIVFFIILIIINLWRKNESNS